MRYNVGDKPRVRGLYWYNMNKDGDGVVATDYHFIEPMAMFCSRKLTIREVCGDHYRMVEDAGTFKWSDDMFDDLR